MKIRCSQRFPVSPGPAFVSYLKKRSLFRVNCWRAQKLRAKHERRESHEKRITWRGTDFHGEDLTKKKNASAPREQMPARIRSRPTLRASVSIGSLLSLGPPKPRAQGFLMPNPANYGPHRFLRSESTAFSQHKWTRQGLLAQNPQ